MKEFSCADETFDVGFGSRLSTYEGLIIFCLNNQIAAIYRATTLDNLWDIGDRPFAARNQNIRSLYQIRIDIRNDAYGISIKQFTLALNRRGGKADDDTMDVSLYVCFAISSKCTVSKSDRYFR